MQKYQESFEIQKDEIPLKCPICKKHEFDFQEDVEIDQVENGFKSTMSCPKCNFKKVLNFTTNKDIEEQTNEEFEDNE